MAKLSVNQTYKFNRSFSGTDTVAFILLPGCSPVTIGSLTTVSYSMFRNKKPVINIGRTNVNGLTRGSRIFAGTMVFTLINQHWLRELIEQASVKDWLGKVKELKVDELPLFDIMIVSANEYGAWCSMFIYGIDVTDEAQTISVQDLFTENVFQFVARDISTFEAGDINPYAVKKDSTYRMSDESGIRFYMLSTSAATTEDLDEYERIYYAAARLSQQYERMKIHSNLSRTLYNTSGERMRGDDVIEIQNLLNESNRLKSAVPVNGVFDSEMEKYVREYQMSIEMDPDGIVTNRLYQYMLYDVQGYTDHEYSWDDFNRIYSPTVTREYYVENINGNSFTNEHVALPMDAYDNAFRGYVINKFGAYIYSQPGLYNNIVGTLGYQDRVKLYETHSNPSNPTERFYRVKEGYVSTTDVLGPLSNRSPVEFPRIEYNDSNAYVRLAEQALQDIYPYEFINSNGKFDANEIELVKRIQQENGIYPSGIIDNDTWKFLQSKSNQIANYIDNDNFKLTFNREPGNYSISSGELVDVLDSMQVGITSKNDVTVKVTATSRYNVHGSDTYSTITSTDVYHDGDDIKFDKYVDAFVYNPTTGKVADQVELTVYPYNKKPYKWIYNYGGVA